MLALAVGHRRAAYRIRSHMGLPRIVLSFVCITKHTCADTLRQGPERNFRLAIVCALGGTL